MESNENRTAPQEVMNTLEEEARILKLHPVTLRAKAATGAIPAHWIGEWRFDHREVLEATRNKKIKAPGSTAP